MLEQNSLFLVSYASDEKPEGIVLIEARDPVQAMRLVDKNVEGVNIDWFVYVYGISNFDKEVCNLQRNVLITEVDTKLFEVYQP